MRLRRRRRTTPPQWGQMVLSGAVLEAVTGCWLSGCWATFIRAFLPLEPAHLTPVYGRLPVFIAGSLPGNTPTLFTCRCRPDNFSMGTIQELCVTGDHVRHQPAIFDVVGYRFAADQRRCCVLVGRRGVSEEYRQRR